MLYAVEPVVLDVVELAEQSNSSAFEYRCCNRFVRGVPQGIV